MFAWVKDSFFLLPSTTEEQIFCVIMAMVVFGFLLSLATIVKSKKG